MSDSKLPSYNRGADGSVRRTWVEGQWAAGRHKPERKRSVVNTLIIVLLVASVPLMLAYLQYGKHLATFGDHSSMLPWLTASPATSASGATRRAGASSEVTRADEQRPWHDASRPADAQAARAVQHAEDALVHASHAAGKGAGLNALAKSLMRTTDSARAALGKGGGGARATVNGASSSDVELKYKYKAAEREVHALEDKVSYLERKVVEDRVHAHDSQVCICTQHTHTTHTHNAHTQHNTHTHKYMYIYTYLHVHILT